MDEFRRGWKIIVAGMLGNALSSTNIIIYTLGMFMPQLHAQFGWGFRDIQLTLIISTLFMMVGIPLAAYLSDRFGPRPVAIFSLCGLSASLMAHAFLTGSIWTYYLVTAIASLVGSGTLALTWTKLITLWFHERRGLALGGALLGTGLGGALLKPISAGLIGHFGWRDAYIGIGLLPLLIAMPVAVLWFKPPPTHEIDLADRTEQLLQGYTYREALAGWRFWALGMCFVPVAIAIGALIANMETILRQQGLSGNEIVGIVTFIGLSVIAGRILGGYLLDRVNAALIGCVLIAIIAVACLLVAIPPVTVPKAFLSVIFVGLGSGVEYDVMAFLIARLFGQRAYSRIYGGVLMFYFAGGALGPFIFGAVFDRYGTFFYALVGTSLALIVSIVLMGLVGAGPSQRASDIPLVTD